MAAPQPVTPAPSVDGNYGILIAAQLKTSFKNLSPANVTEISEPRWVQSNAGWTWLVCVRFEDRGHRRSYALFFVDHAISQARYAVQIDNCDSQAYSPFNLETGDIGASAVGGPGPLY